MGKAKLIAELERELTEAEEQAGQAGRKRLDQGESQEQERPEERPKPRYTQD